MDSLKERDIAKCTGPMEIMHTATLPLLRMSLVTSNNMILIFMAVQILQIMDHVAAKLRLVLGFSEVQAFTFIFAWSS